MRGKKSTGHSKGQAHGVCLTSCSMVPSVVQKMRARVPLALAVARRVPSGVRARAAMHDSCAEMSFAL